jgi:hypothetical protein
MKTSFATAAVCLAIFTMALLPNADAKLTSVRGDGPSERVTQERAMAKKDGQTVATEAKQNKEKASGPPARR